MKRFFRNYKFPIILITSIIIGSIIGIIFGSDAKVLKPLGDLFLNMLYTIVVPLVFFTISSSVSNMLNMKRLGKILRKTFCVFIGFFLSLTQLIPGCSATSFLMNIGIYSTLINIIQNKIVNQYNILLTILLGFLIGGLIISAVCFIDDFLLSVDTSI